MGKQELTNNRGLVARRVPIIGRPHDVANAIEAQVRAGTMVSTPDEMQVRKMADGRVAAIVTIMTVPPPAVRVPKSRKNDTVAAAMGKALVFGTAVMALGLTLIATALVLISQIDWAHVAGFAAVALLVLMVVTNRISHSGGCTGLHCEGCKG